MILHDHLPKMIETGADPIFGPHWDQFIDQGEHGCLFILRSLDQDRFGPTPLLRVGYTRAQLSSVDFLEN